MRLTKNTILITGGSSGIGLELCRVLIAKGNQVLICGRSEEKLAQARLSYPAVQTFCCDLSQQLGREKLFAWVAAHFPACNVLINNAAIVHRTDFYTDPDMIAKAEREVQTNLMAPIALTKLFMPLLEKNANAAIINISSGLVYAPKAIYPIYNATKAALHALSQVLRHQLQARPVRLIEVMMTVVDTPWHKGKAPAMAISAEKAVYETLKKIEKGQEEIKIGQVNKLYLLSRLSPGLAFRLINKATA